MNLLIINAHTDYENSVSNKEIISKLIEKYPQTKIREISKLYPDFKINISEEQKALLEADLIIFQFPFYWFSVPAILKHYFDTVISMGFAFGENGDKLENKKIIISFTASGDEKAYSKEGYNKVKIEELIKPIESLILFTRSNLIGTVYSLNANKYKLPVETLNNLAQTHVKKLEDLIQKNS